FEEVVNPLPGARGLVTFASDPGWAHERLFLWPTATEGEGPGFFVYTPGGDLYVESLPDYSSSALLTGRKGYPAGVPQVVAFSRSLEPEEVAELVKRARAEAAVLEGAVVEDITVAVDWRGRRLPLPPHSVVHAPRVRLRGKQEPAALPLPPPAEPPPVGGTATPPSAPEGFAWLSSDLAAPPGEFAFGTEVLLGSDACQRGRFAIVTDASGNHHPAELVEISGAGEWREAKLRGAARNRGGEGALEQRLLGEDPGDDLRACWIDYDDAGIRFKEWRKVLHEATQESLQTAGLKGPPVCLAICRKFFKHGGDPKAWFAEWAREVGIARKDRSWHEVECLIEALWQSGTFDQLNMGAVAALEAVSRRLLQYVEACAKGADNPNWSAAKHFSATTSALDLVPEDVRMYAARRAREEAELESVRARARQPGAAAHAGADATAAATPAGAPPSQVTGGRRRRLLRDIEAAIDALNWMHGSAYRPIPHRISSATERKILGLQADVRQRVVEAAARWCDVDSAVSERGALARLLKGRSGYTPSPSCSVGSYEYSKVSLPGDLHNAPSLISMLPSEARIQLEDFEKHMLRPAQESELSRQFEGVPGCHTDPALQKNPRAYGRLVRRAADIGLVTFTRDPACALGVFFVTKKADKLRVEIDDSEGSLHGLPLHLGVGDVADCFHRMRLAKTAGGDIRRYFCWPPLAARHAGLTELDGVPLEPGQKIWPTCASLPVGFSWSLHFAQTANSVRLGRQPSLVRSQELSDRGPSLVFGGSRVMEQAGHCTHVDNAGAMSFDGGLVRQALAEAQRDFDHDALRFHEMEVLEHGGSSPGWHLDGDSRVARPGSRRFGLVRQGVRALLRLRKVAGWQLEAVLGHITLLCLMRRELLSIFHVVYRFVRESYGRFQPLWTSAREELVAFVGAMVFIEADWEQPWTPYAYASDASLHGFGVSQPLWSTADVAAVGRVPEVSRYRLGGTRAREHAFEVAGFKVDPESGEVERDFLGRPVRLDREAREILEAARWEHNDDFPEVPSSLLAKARPTTEVAPARIRVLTLERALSDRLLARSAVSSPRGHAGAEESTEAFLARRAEELPAGAGPGPRADAPARGGAEAAGASEESDDSSDPEERAAAAARRRCLSRRGKGHVRQALAALLDGGPLSSRLAPLEARSVTPAAAAQYRQRVQEFLSWHHSSDAILDRPAELDAALASFMNREFDSGHKSRRGEKLLAGVIFHRPQYGRHGADHLPRPLRALKGRCKASPSHSRRPLTIGMRAAICVEMARMGYLLAAAPSLVMVECYLRPGEMLGLTPRSFLPPAPGGVASWALLLFPQEGNLRSKTGESDDSIPLDSCRFVWMDSVYRAVSRRRGSDRLLGWTYREYVSVFRRACARLGWAVVPCQGRRTGASADRAEGLRTQEQVVKRGRWQALKSVRRYEKAGRVNQAWNELSRKDQDRVAVCLRSLEGIFLQGAAPPLPPRARRE
ncbi:unnamed protein product, partial [Prorocentrum cordatum]